MSRRPPPCRAWRASSPRQDLRQDGLGHLSCAVKVATLAPLIIPPRPALAEGCVRHVGDPVAFVVARSKDEARDAAERIVVEYRGASRGRRRRRRRSRRARRFSGRKRRATSPSASRRETRPRSRRLCAGREDRRARARQQSRRRRADRAARRHRQLRCARGELSTSCSPGRACTASATSSRDDVFHMPRERIHLVAPDVGGGFGAKNFLYPEWVLVLFAARRLGRAVKWVSSRNEDFLSSAQGRDNVTRARLALDAKGRFLALDVSTPSPIWAPISRLPGRDPRPIRPRPRWAASTTFPAVFMEVRGVFTNTVPIDAYRGAGKPEANYVIERLIDLAARRMDATPVELRRRNIITRFPIAARSACRSRRARSPQISRRAWRAPTTRASRRGAPRPSGAASCAASGSPAFSRPRAASRARCAGMRFESRRPRSRSFSARNRTARAMRRAFRRSLPIFSACRSSVSGWCRPIRGSCRSGAGHGGARSLHHGRRGARQGDRQGDRERPRSSRPSSCNARRTISSSRREPSPSRTPRPHRGLDLLSVARAALDPAQLPPGMEPGLDRHVDDPLDLFTFPNGCHVAEVEIDPIRGK